MKAMDILKLNVRQLAAVDGTMNIVGLLGIKDHVQVLWALGIRGTKNTKTLKISRYSLGYVEGILNKSLSICP